MKEATAPRTMAPNGPELPAAGVTATRPATMPEQKPRAEALCPLRRSATIQESPAAAVATKVFIIARAAEPLASSAEPALKPNQPTQSRPVPMPVKIGRATCRERVGQYG